MKRVNISSLDFKYVDEDPEGFRSGMARFGPDLGAKNTGSTVYELPPGQALCPYHYEYAEEEWVLVLEGKPTLKDPEGEHELGQWDLVFFTTGPDGAHKLTNETEDPVRLLMYSDLKYPAATVYPDSDKVAVWTGNKDDDGVFRRETKVEYFDREG